MIVIPMAGMSRRFLKAGYREPKFLLPLHGRPLFDYCLGSFSEYFSDETFLFIARKDQGVTRFIEDRCSRLGIQHFEVVELDGPTKGQAETVFLGLTKMRNDNGCHGRGLLIFNIDTIRPGYVFPDFTDNGVDGFLEVFEGEGDNWSFVRVSESDATVAAECAEKRPISGLCSTGLYYFRDSATFCECYSMFYEKDGNLVRGEAYIAPMYNQLISEGKTVRVDVIRREQVIFSGVPEEYESLLQQPPESVAGQSSTC